ncbi:hypothetical protein DESUT3_04180 [Desulfuromonas versatilis]|uniref:YHS domain-containing protein n=1 Tax=Desulfuromonas versatilis TaxID=2802975 RepID=A0ABM8HP39_9BACT|nr:YHS domain-containing protein [Desulfuromonas versatilis]BCR03349.1 hypothetical protein DESUT3_04180 [Desulfuromonas versatilis]
MIRLLIFALLCFLIYTLYTAVIRSLSGKGGTLPGEKTRRGEDMVQDPQCGTYLPRSDALEKSVNGTRHFFCSKECRDAFPGKK